LKELNLYLNKIGTEGVTAIAKVLETNQSLQKLSRNHYKIGSEGIATIAKALETTNRTLRTLCIADNDIWGDESDVKIDEALEKEP